MNRILIIQTAFLGDVILATPLVSELHRLFPEAKIDFLLKKGNESLLQNNPKLNEVIIFDKSSGKWKSILRLIKQFRKNEYDLVINLHRFASSGIIAGFSKGKKRYGFKKNPFSFLYTQKFAHKIGDGTHEVERNLSLIQEFGAKKLVRPELFPSAEDNLHIEKYIAEEFYCLAPASVWFTKQLPKHKWVELTESINNHSPLYLLGASGDSAFCKEIIADSKNKNVHSLCGELTLLQSAALMQKATRNFVNDSGPLHLASAVNANVTAFFCSTIPDFGFGPLSENSDVKEVQDLDCRPCGLHGHQSCPKGHFKCGEITF
ncbi:MAG: glycosyltransferase family 9 protein [Fluviicola sp.]|nr:glycosyltransferase family 9 protein [Fluviicola sp.]